MKVQCCSGRLHSIRKKSKRPISTKNNERVRIAGPIRHLAEYENSSGLP